MDVNGTRFHLIQGEQDWQSLLDAAGLRDLEWDAPRRTVSLTAELLLFPKRASETLLAPVDRRGAGCDRFGNVYWINGEQTGILTQRCGERGADRFWSTDDFAPRCETPLEGAGDFRPAALAGPALPASLRLHGLAVTEDHYLVVGTVAPAGLLLFDLHGGGAPAWEPWPEEIPFVPFDIAPAFGGGVWILDRGSEERGARYWRLDRLLRVVPAGGEQIEIAPAAESEFRPANGTACPPLARWFPAGISLQASSPAEVSNPIAIAGLPDGSVLILDTPPDSDHSIVHRFAAGLPAGAVELGPALLAERLSAPRIRAHDLAFVRGEEPRRQAVQGELYVVSEEGNQAFRFRLAADEDSFELRLVPDYLPMRRYTGKGLETCCDGVYYDLGERWLPLMAQPRRRFRRSATLDGVVLDGKKPDCVWHRLMLDACIPEDASVAVDSRAANDPAQLEQAVWEREPNLHLRAEGSEIPFHQPFSEEERRFPGVGTWELLFQNAKGRYLELRLKVCSSGRTTPRLRAMRVYYPRFSYLERYLPAVYRDDAVSASFLDRYLANVEGLYTSLEGRIAAAEGLFDPRVAPPEYLDWLAGWLGAALGPDWDDARRRLFLENAETLFRWRGTPAGLRAMLEVAIEPCPDAAIFDRLRTVAVSAEPALAGGSLRIVEHFQNRQFAGVELGDPTRLSEPERGAAGEDWKPEHGAEPLHQRFRAFLRRRYDDGAGEAAALANLNDAWGRTPPYAAFREIKLPPVLPQNPAAAGDWLEFTARGLGFTYAPVRSSDEDYYRAFLARRYRRVSVLNQTYQLHGAHAYRSFAEVRLPAEDDFPPGGLRLVDWISFVSLAVPIRDNAHRFSVLIPATPEEGRQARQRRAGQAAEIVRREKPAHTTFDVKLFWALFQVGAARLGIDTALGDGSRYVALVLGADALSEAFLAYGRPWNVKDRPVVGRDATMEI